MVVKKMNKELETLKDFESIISMQDILRIPANKKRWETIKQALTELERLQKKETMYYNALCEIEVKYGDNDGIRQILEKVFT
jgi:hypothetical protein